MFDFGAQKNAGEQEFAKIRSYIAHLRTVITGHLAYEQDSEKRVALLQDVVNKSLQTIEHFEKVSGFNAAKLLVAANGIDASPDISVQEIRDTFNYYKDTKDIRSKLLARSDPVKDTTTIISTIETISKYDSPFGIKTGSPSYPYFSTLEKTNRNICGPLAAFDLMTQKSRNVANLNEEKKKELAEALFAEARPGIMGTFPSNLTAALDNIGEHWGLEPIEHKFTNAGEAVSFVKNKVESHEPVLIKIGNHLLSQHYTTIVGFSGTSNNPEHGYALGADGLKIPLNELGRLMSQGPDSFATWTLGRRPLSRLNLPRSNDPFEH